MVTISGGTFDFNLDGYIPPTWSGVGTHELFSGSELYHLYTDDTNSYVVTNFGLDIYSLVSEARIAYINNDNFKAVAGTSDKVFVGTANEGIKYINSTCVSGSIEAPYDLTACLHAFTSLGSTSNKVKYLHSDNSGLLSVTNSGVDYYKIGPQPYRSSSFINNAVKCFLCEGNIYYTTSGINNESIYKVGTTLFDWTTPSPLITTGSGILPQVNINDIFVTSSTSKVEGYNTLFIATSSGVYIVDEGTLEYAVYYRRT